MHHYTYYSYEEWGRGYIGSRSCKCLPEDDVQYFGSFKDKTFNPTYKIILRSDYKTREECLADEVLLHEFYHVHLNSHFANLAKQTTTKFDLPIEKKIENGIKTGTRMKEEKFGICGRSKEKMREDGRKAGLRSYELKVGVHGRSKEQMAEDGRKAGIKTKEEGIGIHALTQDEILYFAKKGGERAKELGVGIHALTPEQRQEQGRKHGKNGGKASAQRNKELEIGFYALTTEQRRENGKKGGSKSKENKTGIHAETTEQRSERMKEINSQKWMCLETNYVSSPSGLTTYQKNRGIDAAKRIRIS